MKHPSMGTFPPKSFNRNTHQPHILTTHNPPRKRTYAPIFPSSSLPSPYTLPNKGGRHAVSARWSISKPLANITMLIVMSGGKLCAREVCEIRGLGFMGVW